MSSIRNLKNLTSLKLHSVPMDRYAIAMMVQLPNLASLSYDNVCNFPELSTFYIGFSPYDHMGFFWPILRSLRSLTAKFLCYNHHSMEMLGRILKSSAENLVSLTIGFQYAAGRLPADVICSMRFPSLKSLGLHHVEFNDTIIQHFLSTPISPLIDFNIIAHNLREENDNKNDPLWSGTDGVLLSQFPGIGRFSQGATDVGMDAFAMHLKPDTSGNFIVQDISVFEAGWALLPTVLERYPHLKTLNTWESGYPPIVSYYDARAAN